MPDNKRHHYVPRFLLKRFSPDEEYIHMYNIKREKVIVGARLYEQCAKNYLYGESPQYEKLLAGAEGEIAGLFRLIDQYESPPPYMTPMHDAFLMHILIQRSRTTYAVAALNESLDKMMKAIYREHIREEMGIDLDEFKIEKTDPAVYAIGLATQTYPLMYDLGMKLLINETDEVFVTSDNPIVIYNQLMNFNTFGSNCGYACKGLQIFVPLDSRKTMILYDRDVYRVANESKPAVRITNVQDVYELNTLQFVSAQDNIYYEDSGFNAKALHRKAGPFLRAHRSDVGAYPQPDELNKKNVQIVRTSQVDIRTRLSLSFVSVRASAKSWRDKTREMKERPVTFIRSQKLVDAFEMFRELVKMGGYNATQFRDFWNDRAQKKNDTGNDFGK